MQPAELVAVRIAKISEIELAECVLPEARGILDRCPACFDAALMPGVNLFWTVEAEPNRPAIGTARRLAIDRLADHEHRPVTAIGNASLVADTPLLLEQPVVEF